MLKFMTKEGWIAIPRSAVQKIKYLEMQTGVKVKVYYALGDEVYCLVERDKTAALSVLEALATSAGVYTVAGLWKSEPISPLGWE